MERSIFFFLKKYCSAPGTASLSAQKDFLGGGVVKNNPIFVKQILLHHIYAIIWEFIWTKCVTHLLVFLI